MASAFDNVGPPVASRMAWADDSTDYAVGPWTSENGNPGTEREPCVVCFVRESGAVLQPCGHDHFCLVCARRFRSCPLCRAPIPGRAIEGQTIAGPRLTERQPSGQLLQVLSPMEKRLALGLCFAPWLFVFVAGLIDTFNLPVAPSCTAGDPLLAENMAEAARSTAVTWREKRFGSCERCDAGTPRKGAECRECSDGFFNYCGQCFKYYENLPALSVGGFLGGAIPFALIVVMQIGGVISEFLLIARLQRRGMLPTRELVVLALAITIQVARMCLVDVVAQDSFGGRSYSIFREPLPCRTSSACWLGADGALYQTDVSPHSRDTRYYVASGQIAFTADDSRCTVFTADSALLDFGKHGLPARLHGHERFTRLGWVVGAQFSLYYFFATFVNQLADNIFVVPTTAQDGWTCKIFAVTLEVFQLGVLCPAAVFTHGECLHYTGSPGASLQLLRRAVVALGYGLWGFVPLAVPLALGGLLLLLVPCACCWCLGRALAMLLRCGCRGRRRRGQRGAWLLMALDRVPCALAGRLPLALPFAQVVMLLAAMPLLLGGLWLGGLVAVGQASKRGAMQALTAAVLLSDLLFKVLATIVNGALDCALHARIRGAVAAQATAQGGGVARHPAAMTLGRSR